LETDEQIEILLSKPKIEIAKKLFKLGDYDFITVKNELKHEKQERALKVLCDNVHTELYYGGAAGGAKTWTFCAWLAFMSECYPETKWFMGREELKILLSTTYITFNKVCKAYGISDWKLNGQYNFIQFKNGSRIDLLDLKFLPTEDPLYERYGSSEYTGGIIDEAGQVNMGAYDVLKTRTGRHLNDHYGLLRKLGLGGNPKKNFTYSEFYRKHKEGRLEPHKAFIKALLHDNPHRESGYEDALKSLNSEITKQRLLYGNFEYDDDPAKLIDYDKILDCFTNDFDSLKGKKYLTIDVARYGRDCDKFGIWDGWRLNIITKKGLKVTETAAFAKELQKKYEIPNNNTIADEDGVGGGVVDILGCKGFVNNSSALPNPEKPDIDEKGHIKSENYDNVKSQCSFRMAKRINKNGIYIQCDDGDKAEIIEEMEQVKEKEVDSDKKLGILPKPKVKEIIGRSPDNWDCIMMREWFELAPQFVVAVA
jgi:phage terminase large subunit